MCCNPNCANCGTTAEAEAARTRNRERGREILAQARARIAAGEPLPSLDFIKPVGHEGHHHPIRNPTVEEP